MAGVRDQYGLTAKQRKFAENLADGMSQADAYRNAYDASEMQGDTIRSKASLMAQRDDIRAAVDALMGEHAADRGQGRLRSREGSDSATQVR